MSLKPLLENRFSTFVSTFKEWFLASNLDKSVAIVSGSRLIVALVYGSFKNRSLVTFASTEGSEFLAHIKHHDVGLLCATEELADGMRGDDLIVQSKLIRPAMSTILLVEKVMSPNQMSQRFRAPVVVAVDDMLKSDNALRRGFLCALGGTTYKSPSIQFEDSNIFDYGVQISDAERQILEFYAEGLTIDEMTARLLLKKNTVKTYSRNLLNKLGVGNRQKALIKAIELGLIKNIFATK